MSESRNGRSFAGFHGSYWKFKEWREKIEAEGGSFYSNTKAFLNSLANDWCDDCNGLNHFPEECP